MANFGSISFGIMLGGLLYMVGVGVVKDSIGNSMKNDIRDRQIIRGAVVEENYVNKIFGDQYDVSIITSEGKKLAVSYDSYIAGDFVPRKLNVLFREGDTVDLEVATNKDFDGTQSFMGLAGRLVDYNTK